MTGASRLAGDSFQLAAAAVRAVFEAERGPDLVAPTARCDGRSGREIGVLKPDGPERSHLADQKHP